MKRPNRQVLLFSAITLASTAVAVGYVAASAGSGKGAGLRAQGGADNHDEQEGALERDDREGFISGVEHEGAHGVPFDRCWMASSRVKGRTIRMPRGGRNRPGDAKRAPS